MAHRLFLHENHQALGASFVAVDDWQLPSRYTDPLKEYEGVRAGVGVADISHWGKILFKGPDRKEFLQGLLTNDIAALEAGTGLHTCLLTPKGKLTADFYLYNRGEDFLALGTPRAAALLTNALRKYIPLSKSVMEDLSESWEAFSFLGRGADNLCRDLLGRDAPSSIQMSDMAETAPLQRQGATETLKKFLRTPRPPSKSGWDVRRVSASLAPCLWRNHQVHLLSLPTPTSDGYLLLVPRPAAKAFWNRVFEAGKTHHLCPVGFEALEIFRVESGRPALGTDMNSDLYPVEAGLDHAISYTKGCYMGQETIARLKTQGRPPHVLAGIKMDQPCAVGSGVFFDGRAIGKVTSLVRSPCLNAFLALAVVKREQGAVGVAVKVGNPDQEQPAMIVSLPVGARPGHKGKER